MRTSASLKVKAAGERSKALPSVPHVSFRISERRQILMALDLLAANCGLVVYLALRSGTMSALRGLVEHPIWSVILSALWLTLAHTFDAYDFSDLVRSRQAAPSITNAAVLTSALYLLIPYVTPALPPSRLAMLSLPVSLIGAVLAGRVLFAVVFPAPRFQRRALIIGTGWVERTVARILRDEGGNSYEVVGFVLAGAAGPDFVSTAERTNAVAVAVAERTSSVNAVELGATAATKSLFADPGAMVVSDAQGAGRAARPRDAAGLAPLPPTRGEQMRTMDIPVLGDLSIVPNLVRRHGVTTLLVNPGDTFDVELLQLLTGCMEQGLEVSLVTSLHEQLTGLIPVQHVGGHWYAAISMNCLGQRGFGALAKRTLDVLCGCLGLACLACLLPLIALAIYLDSPGPIFYTQERVGQGGRVFPIYKFRSMIPGAETDGPLWAQENDGRVTRVGRLLRGSHLDEAPQFLNVLKGEMSMVGPRPERPEFVERLAAEIPLYRLRHCMRPGMAGWALIKQGYAASHTDALTRLQYDLYYMKHQNLWLDLVIILKTMGHALMLQGRC